MISRERLRSWYRIRLVWVAVVLLAAAGTAVLVRTVGSDPEPEDLQSQLMTWMRTTLEEADPEQHNHAGHDLDEVEAGEAGPPPVICGVHVYGYEPTEATALDEVRTVYGFHLCGVAEPQRTWDFAVKLAGPVIIDMSTDPPDIQVVEATEDVRYIDRLQEMFPEKYAALAQTEALSESEMADLRGRYDSAAGL